MARLVASLHDETGRISIEGFYDGVPELTPELKASVNAHEFNAKEYEKSVGVPPIAGERGYTPRERNAIRPTIEVNGLHSGYGGAGGKTIIPSQAIVKLSVRFVGTMDPAKTLDRVEAHFRKFVPPGFALEVVTRENGGKALMLPVKSPLLQEAKEVLDQISSPPTIFEWDGASIPIVSKLAATSGAEPLLVGWGLEEDAIHAPNESFALSQLRLGFLYACLILTRLSQK
jgi:acetylornithine deacetylase/succinyl-diaminopimelate desuccinylase-like protein